MNTGTEEARKKTEEDDRDRQTSDWDEAVQMAEADEDDSHMEVGWVKAEDTGDTGGYWGTQYVSFVQKRSVSPTHLVLFLQVHFQHWGKAQNNRYDSLYMWNDNLTLLNYRGLFSELTLAPQEKSNYSSTIKRKEWKENKETKLLELLIE